MNSIPDDILKLLLLPFQNNVDSFLVGLVCKKWNSLIKRDLTIHFKTIAIHYAEGGHLSALQWLQERGHTKKYFEQGAHATKRGHLEVLQWLRLNGVPLNPWTSRYAAQSGNLKLLQWVTENGCELNKFTCSFAAYHGQLHILIWARENGCPWDETVCNYAIEFGRMDILEWARANGCPWKESTPMAALRQGNLTILQWLRENGCPWNERELWDTLMDYLSDSSYDRRGKRKDKVTENKRAKLETIRDWMKSLNENLIIEKPKRNHRLTWFASIPSNEL